MIKIIVELLIGGALGAFILSFFACIAITIMGKDSDDECEG